LKVYSDDIMRHLVKCTVATVIVAVSTNSITTQAEPHVDQIRHRESSEIAQIPCFGEHLVPCDSGTGDFGFQICRPIGRDGETAQLNICASTGKGGIGFTLRPSDYCGCCYAVCPDTSACTCPCTNNRGEDGIRMIEKSHVQNFPNRDLSFCAAGSTEVEGIRTSLANKLINLGASPYQCVPVGDFRCTANER
jgi:hypothetical protein